MSCIEEQYREANVGRHRTVRRSAVFISIALIATASAAGTAEAASKASQARTAVISGCRTLGRADITSARFVRDVKTARVQFAKAFSLDAQWRDLLNATDDTIDGFTSGDGELAGEGVQVLVSECQVVRVDFEAKWVSQLQIYQSRQQPAATTPATTRPPAVAPAPRADPRNTANNANLPAQNEGVPFNFPVPTDFEQIVSTLPGRTFRSKGQESTGGQLAVFEQGCKDIGWPIIERVDNQAYVLDGVAGTSAGIVCRSPDGGGAGQPAAWRLRVLIVTVEGRQVFNLWLTR